MSTCAAVENVELISFNLKKKEKKESFNKQMLKRLINFYTLIITIEKKTF